ncbi:MAG: isopentenyl-diphosphate delta-isomerase [Ignavibacteria bacterium]|nr:MAG: isopentenyl-diphosphate delta-isomerase [Ignavibacteria bacterium]KAF0160336.1 MAG: isopentenyl-diphosphate delta-isomerase [Ignavibacteria bacterium]
MMAQSKTSQRKKEHIKLCLTDRVAFEKSNGFDLYEFEHFAITEVDYSKIKLDAHFFGKKISFPFLISCMTGGTADAERINEKLSIAANELNIPIGIGSQRQALENKKFHSTYKIVRKNAGNVPILGNIGAAQVARSNTLVDDLNLMIEIAEADAMVIHINPLQELLQPEGEPNFSGFLKKLEKAIPKISVPIICKEVGSGISKKAAKCLLDVGVQGIDVAGAGGTSWASVELLRNKQSDKYFSEWGLPTSYCVRTVSELKKKYDFMLIASGGINSGVQAAKALALGADLTASARILLQEVTQNDVGGVIKLIINWFETVKKIMYLTGSSNVEHLRKIVLKRKEELV